MTLRSHKNHYNVKFLKGYGFSINVKDSKIILKNNFDPFSEPQTEEWFVNKMPYEKIVLCGKGYISTEALGLLSKHNRNLILLDTYGSPVTFLNPVSDSVTATNYRMAQYDTFRDTQKCRYLTGQILQAKIESQINFLKLTGNEIVKDGISKLESCLANLDDHAEKKASMIYFGEFRKLIPERYGFTARGSSFIRNNKKNATDVINALLNYGYTVLAGEISKFVNGVGLDAYFGFNHRTLANSPALVYDLIEPFRWLVEYSVYKLASVNKIYKREYAHTREGSIILGYDLIRRFLELLERSFRMERRIEFKHGAKTQDGLKAVQEITIAKIAVQNLVDYCVGKRNSLLD